MDKSPKDKSEFLLQLFEEGKNFTQELLRENERLRLLVAAQKSDSEIRRKLEQVPPNALNRLEMENKRYKEELEQLRQTLTEVEAENMEFAQKYVSVEQQNASLANLYVASYQLHSTLDFKAVINIIKEIVINLIGSEMFGIFLKDDSLRALQLVAHEGLEGEKTAPVTIGTGPIGQAAKKGETYFWDKNGKGDQPIACVPLKIQGQLLGIIVIYELLRQKNGFTPVDVEMLAMMADHASTAIYCSQLHSRSERKLNTIQSALELLKMEQ